MKYAKYLDSKIHLKKYIPTILSGWDNTPRYGVNGIALDNYDPRILVSTVDDYFKNLPKTYKKPTNNLIKTYKKKNMKKCKKKKKHKYIQKNKLKKINK